MARLRHRWRYRTMKVTRLRAHVYGSRCSRCKAVGRMAYDGETDGGFGTSTTYTMLVCTACGASSWAY